MTRRIGKRFRAGQKVEHEGADTMTGPGIGRTTRPGQTARARRMPARCMPALGLSAGIAVASMWSGLTVAYLVPSVPPSFGILGVATAVYLSTFAWSPLRRRHVRARAVGRGSPDGAGASVVPLVTP